MRRPQGAYVAGNAAANREATAEPPTDAPTLVVLVYGQADAVWRRDVAATLRGAGLGVRMASGTAEGRKALADGRVTHLVLDDGTDEASAAALGWPPERPIVYRRPGEPGAGTGTRLLERLFEGPSGQGTTSA